MSTSKSKWTFSWHSKTKMASRERRANNWVNLLQNMCLLLTLLARQITIIMNNKLYREQMTLETTLMGAFCHSIERNGRLHQYYALMTSWGPWKETGQIVVAALIVPARETRAAKVACLIVASLNRLRVSKGKPVIITWIRRPKLNIIRKLRAHASLI